MKKYLFITLTLTIIINSPGIFNAALSADREKNHIKKSLTAIFDEFSTIMINEGWKTFSGKNYLNAYRTGISYKEIIINYD